MNLRQLLQHFTKGLTGLYEEQEIISIFNIVVHHVSGFDRGQLILKWGSETEHELHYLEILASLKTGKPLQYILGETFFYGLPFKVSPAVLIPRPETEELVEWVISTCKAPANKTILDIGTGSGCIAISIKKNLYLADVSALDVSEEALQIAIKNADLNNVDVNFITADILTYNSSQKFDVIVSNPPYVTREEMGGMHQNVLENEPHLALFAPDERPLLFYEAIAEFAKSHLNENGFLFFEINEHLGKETVQMLLDKSFRNIDLRKDMQRKDRMIRCMTAGI